MKKPELFKKMEVFVDGGVREGAHVVSLLSDWLSGFHWVSTNIPCLSQVMALALGAKGVGLGRLPLYANGTYGLDGLKKMYESKWLYTIICEFCGDKLADSTLFRPAVLQEEVRATMGMCGARSIDELTPDMVRRKTYYDRL